ncbi:hypothetical protein WJX74_002867 [Apatococcus lobatus]|uniref:Major facilitator superfamily (MFS) profile domain-containing protein n=1 Tax=Apatococcus lobatus TaxID=904363 RepID=A0AAW1QJK1_9CHLO
MNWNVYITLLQRVGDSFAQGIWAFVALPTYIWLIENHSNKAVGYAQGIQGFAMAAVAVPASLMADRTRRDMVLRLFAFVGLGGCVAFLGAVYIGKQPLSLLHIKTDTKLVAICGASALWGIYTAAQPVVESIFADSVPTGARIGLYSTFTALTRVAICFGPLGAALMFWWSGNVWEVHVIEQIMLVGVGLSAVSILPMFVFNDDKTLGADSDAYQELLTIQEEEDEPVSPRWRVLRGHITTNSIPWLLAGSDIIIGLASGMTLKFIPIFLLQACALDPITVNIYTFISPLLIAAIMFSLPPIAKTLGRVQVLLLLKCLGVGLLYWMALIPSIWKRPLLIMSVSLARMAFMNSGYPIQKSILMDYVPRSTRARWNSVDTFMNFAWSGSAVVGGFLIDSAGFRITFFITAAMQTISLVFLFALLPVVPVKQSYSIRSRRATQHGSRRGTQHGQGDTGRCFTMDELDALTEALLAQEPRSAHRISEPC